MTAAVELEGVWKQYLLGQQAGVRDGLRAMLGRRSGRDVRWALQDLSLTLQPGESVGLIGHNGAGKTTTLKLLAGITRATRGRVQTRGRVASLINVGAGFHRELTGRENVFLNGVILGLSRREVGSRYEEIVAMAGLERFMDTPVKHYSSGMYARLAFSVAVHVDPDILLVDEVLSVGDAEFQDRSLRRMLAFRDSGAAVIFVSHNLASVELMCQRAVWLERGAPRAIGLTADVIRAYLDAFDESEYVGAAHRDDTGGAIAVQRVSVLDSEGAETSVVALAQPFAVRVEAEALRDLHEPVFVVTVRADHGPLFAGNMHIDGNWPERIARGPFSVACVFDAIRLEPGSYRIELKVKQNVRTNYFEPRILARFTVPGAAGAEPGAVVPHEWRFAPLGESVS